MHFVARGPVVVDVGTGCGAIAIAVAKAIPNAEVYAIDQSAEALKVATANARRHDVSGQLIFWQGDLLDSLPDAVDLILANLPYIPTAGIATLAPEVRDYEPRAALDGGPDGLDLIRELLIQAPRRLQPTGGLALEFGAGQELEVLKLTRKHFPRGFGQLRRDLAGNPRCLVLTSWLA
jgi:release factor glutamine methyltransferase